MTSCSVWQTHQSQARGDQLLYVDGRAHLKCFTHIVIIFTDTFSTEQLVWGRSYIIYTSGFYMKGEMLWADGVSKKSHIC